MSRSDQPSNFELRKKLKALMTQAQHNETKLEKMQQQELRFISADSLPELIDIILQQYRDAYELDYVSLLLIDPDYEIRYVIEFMSPGLLKLPTLIFADTHTQLENVVIAQNAAKEKTNPADLQKTLFPNFKNKPYLGKCTGDCREVLFPAMQAKPESVAVLPLIRHNKLIGSLNLASLDVARFIEGIGTNLINRLSSILAVCLENAVNNEKLKLLGLTVKFFDSKILMLHQYHKIYRQLNDNKITKHITIKNITRINQDYCNKQFDNKKAIANLENAWGVKKTKEKHESLLHPKKPKKIQLQKKYPDFKLNDSFRIIAVTQIAKYLPGNIAHLLGRFYLTKNNISKSDIAYSITVENIMFVVSSLFIGSIYLFYFDLFSIFSSKIEIVPYFSTCHFRKILLFIESSV